MVGKSCLKLRLVREEEKEKYSAKMIDGMKRRGEKNRHHSPDCQQRCIGSHEVRGLEAQFGDRPRGVTINRIFRHEDRAGHGALVQLTQPDIIDRQRRQRQQTFHTNIEHVTIYSSYFLYMCA